MLTPKRAGNTTRMNAAFPMVNFITEKTIIAKPLDSELTNDQKQRVLTWRKILLTKVKKYIDANLNPAKVNVIDPTKDNFTQPLGIQEILDELEISNYDCYKALQVPKDNDLELHLKMTLNSFFVNNYFDVGLKAWHANMDIQPICNEYKAVIYMFQKQRKNSIFLKQRINAHEPGKEAYDNNMHHHDTMKTIAKAYLNSQ